MPTQADLDDYERRMELMRQRKPVLWGPDQNAYSYNRHVQEEQDAQRRRELEVMAGRGGRSNDLGSAAANRQQDIEAELARELGMSSPKRDNSWTSERISRTLNSFGTMPDSEFYRTKEELDASPTGSPEFEHLKGMFRFYSDGMAEQREAASRQQQQPQQGGPTHTIPGGNAGMFSVPPGKAPGDKGLVGNTVEAFGRVPGRISEGVRNTRDAVSEIPGVRMPSQDNLRPDGKVWGEGWDNQGRPDGTSWIGNRAGAVAEGVGAAARFEADRLRNAMMGKAPSVGGQVTPPTGRFAGMGDAFSAPGRAAERPPSRAPEVLRDRSP
jgi:hypothetical protein